MSRKELSQVAAFSLVKEGTMTQTAVATQLGLSLRQVQRKWSAYKRSDYDPASLVHKLRGQPSNRRLDETVVARAVELGKTKSTRETMTLAPKDAAELFRLVAESDWRTMPENPSEFALQGRPSCADCCSGALYIKTAEGGRSLNYAGDRKPEPLEALMKGIDDILGRGAWTRVVYPWEQQR